MQTVSYMGDGSTTEFSFNFLYFEKSNVVVTKNGTIATGYNIIGNSDGQDADIPFIGGTVIFETAPSSIDCITIARQLPLARITDYQPLEKINPTTLNQDLNYLMEVIKDRKDELEELTTKYAEIADKESTEIILARISAIHDEITDIDAKIQALGDISTLRQDVNNLTTTVGGHTTSIDGLNTTVGGHTTSISTLNTQKSNIDMDNLSNTGKNEIAHMSMPSNRYVDLTLPASGQSIIAPADGWVVLSKTCEVIGQFLLLENTQSSLVVINKSASQTGYIANYIETRKGDSIRVEYNLSGETRRFRFVYAEGAQ